MKLRAKRTRIEVRKETLFEVLVLDDRRMPPVIEVLNWFHEKYGSQYEDYEIDSVDNHPDGWILIVVALHWQYEGSGDESINVGLNDEVTHVSIRHDGTRAHDCTGKGLEMTTDIPSRS